jgi:hypothetical protein
MSKSFTLSIENDKLEYMIIPPIRKKNFEPNTILISILQMGGGGLQAASLYMIQDIASTNQKP